MKSYDLKIKTIVKQNASEKVAEEIKRLILKNKIKPGSKLPSERSLSEQFGVGRYTVREGLAILQTSGIITVLSGKGAFVGDDVRNTIKTLISDLFTEEEESIKGLLETRCYLESIAAKLAAKRITDSEIEALSDQLEMLRTVKTNNLELNTVDERFHHMIAEATHNESLAILVKKTIQASKSQIKKNIFEYSKALNLLETGIETIYTKEFSEQNFAYHKRIFDAIASHDEHLAEEAMFDHLSNGILVKHLEKRIQEITHTLEQADNNLVGSNQ